MPDLPASLPSALATTRPAAAYARASLAPATLRAYQAGWQAFSEWSQLAGRTALPAAPETVAEHLASLATLVGRASWPSGSPPLASTTAWPTSPSLLATR